MANPISLPSHGSLREEYQQNMLQIASAFKAGSSGAETVIARSLAIDSVTTSLWSEASSAHGQPVEGVALVALGGYGRRELFPSSDVDLMFLVDSKVSARAFEKTIKLSIQRVSQTLWDCGLRVSPLTRRLNECERFDSGNAEFALALLDQRFLAGDNALHARLAMQVLPKLFDRNRDAMLRRLQEITLLRHAKYGGTLFHLEPNIKECPGGLRDVHVCRWITLLRASLNSEEGVPQRSGGAPRLNAGAGWASALSAGNQELQEAIAFLELVRCFLHFRHERDDNTLDWQAQDAAAALGIGLNLRGASGPDAAYWMRLYFRHARAVERATIQMLDAVPTAHPPMRLSRLTHLGSSLRSRARPKTARHGFRVERGRIEFDPLVQGEARPFNPAHDPETVLRVFESMSATGCRLGMEAEQRLSQALPLLSADLEEGPALWRHIEAILTGHYAGKALRSMHALGILELLLPEFHGIDALVIRDAYHRYTVDEHTFVLIDSLHDLEAFDAPAPPGGASHPDGAHPMAEWASRFGQLLRDLQQPGLLYLVALLHDTGKGRSSGDHAGESVRMAQNVFARLELDGYESNLVLRLIGSHLEMSAALRRDIFDTDTVRGFAARVQTPEALRMLTLFTYADIQAVHPDALTPWKAENLWRLYLATSNSLERNLDEDRVGMGPEREQVLRVTAMIPNRRLEVEQFLEGLPARYLSTRTPEQVRSHFERSTRFHEDAVQLDFSYSPNVNEITLVTPDRPLLFANLSGALAAWGMNIITAEAFSNRAGVVVDTFRFTDAFSTLEMNVSERDRFVRSVHDVVSGAIPVETLLHGRRRSGRRKSPMMRVAARVDFDDNASAHSTLLQVVAQDTPGLLRVLALTLAAHHCNVDVALIDTEGETAIDVFYITRENGKLVEAEEQALRKAMLTAIEDYRR